MSFEAYKKAEKDKKMLQRIVKKETIGSLDAFSAAIVSNGDGQYEAAVIISSRIALNKSNEAISHIAGIVEKALGKTNIRYIHRSLI
jgi:hypothetical protein